jgi:ubiquinone/menaquinone biosynthesis C-methylase UbiE
MPIRSDLHSAGKHGNFLVSHAPNVIIPSLKIFSKTSFSAASYATFRPSYPQSLYQEVLRYHRGQRQSCVDLGCGHGVVARAMSEHFDSITGTDPSSRMIEQAQSSTSSTEYPNVKFREASAESLPFVADSSVDMVVAGQAAHWFDYTKVFNELARTVKSGGSMAFWGYKDHVFVDSPTASSIMDKYAYDRHPDMLGSYWQQPGRSIVQNLLRDVKPPSDTWQDIKRIEYEPGTNGRHSGHGTMFMSKSLKIGECKEYIRTWSSYHSWREAHPSAEGRSRGGSGDVVDQLFDEIASIDSKFGSEETSVDIEWGSVLLLARKQ